VGTETENNSKTSVLVRMEGWQKKDLEEAARAENRSVNNFVLNTLAKRRKWKDRPEADTR